MIQDRLDYATFHHSSWWQFYFRNEFIVSKRFASFCRSDTIFSLTKQWHSLQIWTVNVSCNLRTVHPRRPLLLRCPTPFFGRGKRTGLCKFRRISAGPQVSMQIRAFTALPLNISICTKRSLRTGPRCPHSTFWLEGASCGRMPCDRCSLFICSPRRYLRAFNVSCLHIRRWGDLLP